MKKHEKALVADNALLPGRRAYPYHPFPPWLVGQINIMPRGFAAAAQTTLLSLDTIALIQSSCKINTMFEAWLLRVDRDNALTLVELTKEAIFRCNDLLQQRKLNRVEELLVLGLSAYCQYIAKDTALRSSNRATGLGIAVLLTRISCTFLARSYGLETVLDLNSPSISNAIVWAGSILMATSPEENPGWALGQRLLRLCNNHMPDWSKNTNMCRLNFVWPGSLLGRPDKDSA